MILSEAFPELLEEWSYSQNIHSPESNLSSRTRIHWVCRNCKKEWVAELGARTRSSKPTGCPHCSRKRSLKAAHDSTRKIVDLSSYPEILKDFSQRENPIINQNRIEGSSTIITWICHICKFKWDTSIGNRIKSSNQTGCPQCSKRIIKEKQRNNAIKNSGTIVELFPELLKNWNYSKNLFKPENLSYRSKEKIF